MKNKSLFYFLSFLLFTLCALRFANAANPYAGKFYADGPSSKKEFALTYDDGPGFMTEELLKLLDKYGARASFFMTGSAVRANPAKAAAVAAGAHLLCSHTDRHKNYFKIGNAPDREKALEKELDKAAEAILHAAGKRPVFLRMPNGYIKDWVKKTAARKGYVLVNWTYGSDWTNMSEDKMTGEYLKHLKPGAILLMHDGGGRIREKTLRITEKLLLEAGKKGLKAVTLEKLLDMRDTLLE
ncbi:MAG: polysaccharide deacetylase family protein [Elusimicrobia bacterium]|nr:polysaccharide deacetylase family protein [Elusimicrobiota bacterium]